MEKDINTLIGKAFIYKYTTRATWYFTGICDEVQTVSQKELRIKGETATVITDKKTLSCYSKDEYTIIYLQDGKLPDTFKIIDLNATKKILENFNRSTKDIIDLGNY